MHDKPVIRIRFKTESAHYINRLLGRPKRTVWCEGYDSPIMLTYRRALIAIGYLYANAGKDNLTHDIDSYPGFSTWKMFRAGETQRTCKRLSRRQFEFLTRDSHNLRGYTKRAQEISDSGCDDIQLATEPNAWLEAFGIVDGQAQARSNKIIIERVRTIESRAATILPRPGSKLSGTYD